MKDYPIEKQVCSLEQAKELAELLGDDAPGSYFIWLKQYGHLRYHIYREIDLDYVDTYQPVLRAYTGDELGALLKRSANWKEYSGHSSAQKKATLAIEGLKDGWIKREDFRYE